MKTVVFKDGYYARVDRAQEGRTQTIQVDFFREVADQLTHIGASRVLVGRVCPALDAYPSEVFDTGDLYEVQDELEAYLIQHPGWVAWLDSFVRLRPREPLEPKGLLTQHLAKVLDGLKEEGTLSGPLLIFPCSYGEGYDPEANKSLQNLYETTLDARPLTGTRLMRRS